ncbi:hypothetical protein KA977_07885 [Candidatus Dependentiae bacterium]|nr:hypothetical protein [Candidatus Dependentiae bacterium]
MINFFIILFGITLLYISGTSRLEAYIKMLSLQGIFLAVIVTLNVEHSLLSSVIVLIETIVFKSLIIPWFLFKTLRENKIKRETEPYIPNFYSLLIVSSIFFFGFILTYWSIENTTNAVRPLSFGMSISTIITGLFIIISRKKLLTHLIGFIILENGIFLLSVSSLTQMPIIVDLGVLLDIFLVILLLGLFLNKVKSTFEELEIDNLTNLKD